MHAAVADQAQEVQPFALGLREGFLQRCIASQFAIADRLVDAGEVLVNDASGTQVEVAHLAVAHLPGWQAHVLAAGAHGTHRIGGVEVVVEGCAGEKSRVAVLHRLRAASGVNTPAVADNENNRFFGHKHRRDACCARLGQTRRFHAWPQAGTRMGALGRFKASPRYLLTKPGLSRSHKQPCCNRASKRRSFAAWIVPGMLPGRAAGRCCCPCLRLEGGEG